MQVIVTTEEDTIVVSDTDSENTIITETEVTYTITSPAEQGPTGTVTLTYITNELISTDTSNGLTVGTDGKLLSSPVLASSQW